MSLATFGVRKPVAADLVMWAIIGAGLIFGFGLRREFFPEVRPSRVIVAAPYPGASPEEIEDSLASKIEDRLVDLRDVKEVTSTVTEGLASITVEFEDGVRIEDAIADVQREVDALQDLPEESERIIVAKFEPNIPVLSVSIFGEADERVMKGAIREIRDDLRSLPDMGEVRFGGVRTDELTVEVRPGALLEHGLSLVAVAERVRQAMIDLPGGSVRSATSTISVRTMGAAERAGEVRAIVVKAEAGGRPVRLGEIAEVTEGFVDAGVLTRLNGRRCVSLTVYKVGEEDAVDMSEAIKAYVAGRTGRPLTLTWKERLKALFRPPDGAPLPRVGAHRLGLSKPTAPPGEIALTNDLARFIVGRLATLTEDGLTGALLIFVTLVLVLNWRVAWWVTLGLIVSIMGTLAAMHFLGITLNLLTMFGLIIVLGLLADDAIVISENIIAHHERGEPADVAAERGTNEVYWPVIATVLTMIFAFVPLGLIEGQVGDFLSVLPWVVGTALVVSIVEALLILPAHMAHTLRRLEDERAGRVRPGRLRRFEAGMDAGRDRFFNRFLIPRYCGLLGPCLRRPYLTLACAVAMVIGSSGLYFGGRLPFVFFDASDSETVFASLRMPIGTPIDETDRAVRLIEAAVAAEPEVKSIYSVVGFSGNSDGGDQTLQSHLATMILEFHPVESRDRTSNEILASIRTRLGEPPGIKSLRFQGVEGGAEGPPISLAVAGDDPGVLLPAVARIEGALAEYRGVQGIADDADAGQRELRLTLREGASELGFTTEIIARQVRASVYGIEAHTFAGEREDVDVRVRLAEGTRRSLAAIEAMHVFTPAGAAVPLGEVVRLEEAPGYATVRRINGDRAITVSAEVDRAVANPDEIVGVLRPLLRRIEAETPGLRILERGQQKEMAESFATLPLGMLTAAGLIYATLAWLFSSYVQPLVVMTAIPFATVGMIWGHVIMGYDLTFLSLIGFIALAGIVVNDSLIFIEFYNRRRRDGLSVHDAALDTGRSRLRAILLTTATTVPGLAPLMLSQSFQARFLIPMAVTICFGLIASTVLILVALPCLLVVVDDAKRLMATAWTGRVVHREATRPPGEPGGSGGQDRGTAANRAIGARPVLPGGNGRATPGA